MNNIYLYLIFFIIGILNHINGIYDNPSVLNGEECIEEIGNCSYYMCLEDGLNCGNESYLISYGHKMCNRYDSMKEHFSYDGLYWIFGVRECLQKYIHNFLLEYEDDEGKEYNYASMCHDIEKVAFESHTECYTDDNHNICDLNVNDWSLIFGIVSEVIIERPMETFSQMLKVSSKCYRQLPMILFFKKGIKALIKVGYRTLRAKIKNILFQ